MPSEDTYITHNHTLYFNNYKILAKNFTNNTTVTEVNIKGTTYNVLLDNFIHSKMTVNNLKSETLHPLNKKAIKYYKNYVANEVKNKNFSVLKLYSIVRQLIPDIKN